MAALDRALRLLFTALAAAFAVTGLLFFCFPDATVATLNAAGRPFGFPPAPASPLRFWLSLAVAYMMLVTLLAAAIARDPRRRAAPASSCARPHAPPRASNAPPPSPAPTRRPATVRSRPGRPPASASAASSSPA